MADAVQSGRTVSWSSSAESDVRVIMMQQARLAASIRRLEESNAALKDMVYKTDMVLVFVVLMVVCLFILVRPLANT